MMFIDADYALSITIQGTRGSGAGDRRATSGNRATLVFWGKGLPARSHPTASGSIGQYSLVHGENARDSPESRTPSPSVLPPKNCFGDKTLVLCGKLVNGPAEVRDWHRWGKVGPFFFFAQRA